TPVYVAGLERGVRPMGDWSTLTTLSRCSMPLIDLWSPGGCFDLYTRCISARSRMSLTSVDLPDPDTPVTATNLPSGDVTSMLRRLCSRAPFTTRLLPLPMRRTPGTGMLLRPDKYWPVSESFVFSRPFTGPV